MKYILKLAMIIAVAFSFSVQNAVAEKKAKAKLVEANKRIAQAAVMHGTMDKKTKVWQDGDVVVSFEIQPDYYHMTGTGNKNEPAICDSIFVDKANIQETNYGTFGDGFMMSDCVIKFRRKNSLTYMTFTGKAFSSLTNYLTEHDFYEGYLSGNKSYACLQSSIVLVEGDFSIHQGYRIVDGKEDTSYSSGDDKFDNQTDETLSEYPSDWQFKSRNVFNYNVVPSDTFVVSTLTRIDTNSRDYLKGLCDTVNSIERKVNVDKFNFKDIKRQISKCGDFSISMTKEELRKKNILFYEKNGYSVDDWIDIVITEDPVTVIIDEVQNYQIFSGQPKYKSIVLRDSTVINIKTDYSKKYLELESIIRPDGDFYHCSGSMEGMRLTAPDGRYLEGTDPEHRTYYDGKNKIYIGGDSPWNKNNMLNPTFKQWYNKELADYSKAFYTASIYNTKGEIIETIEKGKTSAQIKREKQKEEADIKRAYEELVRKYGKEWVQYVEKGNHPKVGMPEGLLDYYPAVVTDDMGDTKRYRIFLGNGRHFHVWCHNGKVSSVHY